nr:hypothetical protein [Salmonella enterica]
MRRDGVLLGILVLPLSVGADFRHRGDGRHRCVTR